MSEAGTRTDAGRGNLYPRDLWYMAALAAPFRPGAMQRVMLLGADGKDYEALYTLELQEDGVWRITAVSMREAKTLST